MKRLSKVTMIAVMIMGTGSVDATIKNSVEDSGNQTVLSDYVPGQGKTTAHDLFTTGSTIDNYFVKTKTGVPKHFVVSSNLNNIIPNVGNTPINLTGITYDRGGVILLLSVNEALHISAWDSSAKQQRNEQVSDSNSPISSAFLWDSANHESQNAINSNAKQNLEKPTAVPLPTVVWAFGAVLLGILRLNRRKNLGI
jgi:hypothetical protein